MFDFLNFYKSTDPMGMILFIYPLLVFILSLIMQLIVKKKLIILLINFVWWMVATFTIFTSSFLIWCFIYTFHALLGTLTADLIIKSKNKFVN